MVLVLLANVALLGLTLFGLVTSVRERFVVGVVGGIVRVVLLGFAIVAVFRLQLHLTERLSREAFMPAILMSAAGPILTNAMLVIAHLRRRRFAAAEQEIAARPFGAWLGAAAVDVMVLFVTVFGAFMATKQDGT